MRSDEDSRDLSVLVPEFRDKALLVIENCRKRGIEMRPFFTLRGPTIQAKLWRQSRSIQEIDRAVKNLRKDAPFLANILQEAGPQYGKWATNALPGQSWHQWGEAIDCYVLNTLGQAVWSSQHAGYNIYAEEVLKLGLTAGHSWKNRDSVHVQLISKSVRELHTWAQIEEEMKKRYS